MLVSFMGIILVFSYCLIGHSDSDYVGDVDDRRSITD